MERQLRTALLLAALAMLPLNAIAQAAHNHDHGASAGTAAVSKAPSSEGEVRKVNKTDGTMTLRHGPLENLGMPPMTMTFRVKDPAMLEQVKEGDKVRFVADSVNGKLTLVQLEAVR